MTATCTRLGGSRSREVGTIYLLRGAGRNVSPEQKYTQIHTACAVCAITQLWKEGIWKYSNYMMGRL
jgi:hypothetical protein